MNNPVKHQRDKGLLLVLATLTTVYLVSIIWVNFHSALWYGMDMFTYAYEGRLMHEGHTFFPDNWVFSNQYHIVSSPNLAALLLYVCKDSTTAMALASSLLTLCILFCFLWFIPYYGTGHLGKLTGALCMIGGIIFGYNAASYISGMQVLYTMCSYYSCYLIGILLSVGCWLRLTENKHIHWALLLLAFLLNFALGMQSLREMLILNIPLLLLDVLLILFEIKKQPQRFSLFRPSTIFVFTLLFAELAGHLFMEALHIPTTPNINSLSLTLTPSGLAVNIWASTKNLLRISGMAIASDGLHYLPLSICALLVALLILWSLVRIIRTKDTSPMAKAIVFSFLSVLCVYGIGIFLMRTRDIYYFVYWLLAALSITYTIENCSHRYSILLTAVLMLICLINYGYSFLPNYKDYRANGEKLEAFTKSLIDRGVKVIYVDASPIFAAASNDRIVSQSFWFDSQLKSGYPLTVFLSDKDISIFDDAHYENALICLSDYSSHFIHNISTEFHEALMSKMVLFDEITLGTRHYVFYKPTGRIINPILQNQLNRSDD